MRAIGGEFIRANIAPEATRGGDLGQQVANELVELVLRSVDVPVSMQQRHEVGGLVPAVVRDERVNLEHCVEPLITRLIPERGEMLEVADYMTLVPGNQDRLKVGEILVQRHTSDAGLLAIRHIRSDLNPRSPTSPRTSR